MKGDISMRKYARKIVPLGLVSVVAGLVAVLLTGTAGLAVTQVRPTNTQPPTIGGTPQVGSTLTAREAIVARCLPASPRTATAL